MWLHKDHKISSRKIQNIIVPHSSCLDTKCTHGHVHAPPTRSWESFLPMQYFPPSNINFVTCMYEPQFRTMTKLIRSECRSLHVAVVDTCRHVPVISLFNSLCLVPVTFLQHVCELLKLLQIEILLLNLLVEGFDLFLEWEISVLKFACDRLESTQNHVSGICSKQYFNRRMPKYISGVGYLVIPSLAVCVCAKVMKRKQHYR